MLLLPGLHHPCDLILPSLSSSQLNPFGFTTCHPIFSHLQCFRHYHWNWTLPCPLELTWESIDMSIAITVQGAIWERRKASIFHLWESREDFRGELCLDSMEFSFRKKWRARQGTESIYRDMKAKNACNTLHNLRLVTWMEGRSQRDRGTGRRGTHLNRRKMSKSQDCSSDGETSFLRGRCGRYDLQLIHKGWHGHLHFYHCRFGF